MLSFLKQFYEAIDYSVDGEVLSFYCDFLKAFDRVPHCELLKEEQYWSWRVYIGNALRLSDGKETIRKSGKLQIGQTSTNERCTTRISAGTTTLLLFHKRLTKFSEPYIFDDGLKIRCVGKNREVQDELNSIEKWVAENQMTLALDKFTNLTFRGKDETYHICDTKLK